MGKLFIVATPIGNLKDITLRALETLRQVDFVVCEDTRETIKLLYHYRIKKELVSFHQHSKVQKIDFIVDKLKKGKNIALVTDSGTPGISDPGGVLTQKCRDEKIKVVPIPGPSALTASISISGLKSAKFEFLGFLPKKKRRQLVLSYLKRQISDKSLKNKAFIIYESPHRLQRTLIDFQKILGKRKKIIICRELTKKFEEIREGAIKEMISYFSKGKVRGEFVIILKS